MQLQSYQSADSAVLLYNGRRYNLAILGINVIQQELLVLGIEAMVVGMEPQVDAGSTPPAVSVPVMKRRGRNIESV